MKIPQDLLDTANAMIKFSKADKWFDLEIEPIEPMDVIAGLGLDVGEWDYLGPTTRIGKVEGVRTCKVKLVTLPRYEGLGTTVHILNDMDYAPLEGHVYRSFIKKYSLPYLPEGRSILFGSDTWRMRRKTSMSRTERERTYFINLDGCSSRSRGNEWRPYLVGLCSALGEDYWIVRSLAGS